MALSAPSTGGSSREPLGSPGTGHETAVLVCARFRPFTQQEARVGSREVVNFERDGKSVTVESDEAVGTLRHSFTFDCIFPPSADQNQVFDYVARPIIKDVMNGYYATIFAYGQTGSGKTYTMEGVQGDAELRGLIPRTIESLFEHIGAIDGNFYDCQVSVSYVEIYRERIRCLLDKGKGKENLEIRMDLGRGVYVEGATERVVNTDKAVLETLVEGSRSRHTAFTLMNEESSRSHAIFMITVSQKDLRDLTQTTGKLIFVDLAGSETVAKTGATDERLEEAKHINKSLSALGNVIKALTDSKATYVPYRDSKLTRMLQDSLGGSSRTALIINCSSSAFNLAETLSTLRFGSRAKRVRNKPRQHVGYGGTEVEEILLKREEEIARLRGQVNSMGEELRRTQTVQLATQEALRTREAELLQAQERVKRFESHVGAVVKEATLTEAAVKQMEAHLSEEKHLFAELRLYFARILKRVAGGGTERAPSAPPKEQMARLDELLAMASWRSQAMLSKLTPILEVAKDVAATRNTLLQGRKSRDKPVVHVI